MKTFHTQPPTLAVCILTLVAACAGDDGASDERELDAGRTYHPTDAGTPEPSDPVDGGGLGNPDAGPPTSAACGDPPALPPELKPRCESATRDCIAGCASMDQECRIACVEADTHPIDEERGVGCMQCVITSMFACLDANGCDEVIAETFCCLGARCGDGSAEDCSETECGSELDAMFTCGATVAPQCQEWVGPELDDCFVAEVSK